MDDQQIDQLRRLGHFVVLLRVGATSTAIARSVLPARADPRRRTGSGAA
jgi:hypothetical protein